MKNFHARPELVHVGQFEYLCVLPNSNNVGLVFLSDEGFLYMSVCLGVKRYIFVNLESGARWSDDQTEPLKCMPVNVTITFNYA